MLDLPDFFAAPAKPFHCPCLKMEGCRRLPVGGMGGNLKYSRAINENNHWADWPKICFT